MAAHTWYHLEVKQLKILALETIKIGSVNSILVQFGNGRFWITFDQFFSRIFRGIQIILDTLGGGVCNNSVTK